MRVAICWPEMNGYMAACWRELAKREDVELLIVAGRPGTLLASNAYDAGVFADLPCQLYEAAALQEKQGVAGAVVAIRPDVVVLPGWSVPAFVALAFHPGLGHARFVMGLDTPREDTWRQTLARLKVGRYVDRMDCVIVPGERSWQFARHHLKIPEARLRRGLYGVDYAAFASTYERRLSRPAGWPRGFLFVGRYAPLKGLDLLLEAYRQYRERVAEPWPLTCSFQHIGILSLEFHVDKLSRPLL